MNKHKDLSLAWGVGVFIFAIIVGCFFALTFNGCTKNTTVTGPPNETTVHDTVKVIVHDTVEVEADIQSQSDFYDALQKWINPQLDGLVSYYPTIGTDDIAVSGSTTLKTFALYWIVIDFGTGEIWAYAGVFEVSYQGNGAFTFKDKTGAGSPPASRGKLATRNLQGS